MPDSAKTVVLVVEDEPLILMDAMQSLEDAGFEVIDAYDAEHALLCLDERPDIGAVFTDVNMPGRFDGVQLARMVNERRPDVVVIVTSGAVKVRRTDLPEGGQFVPKPLSRRKRRQSHPRTGRLAQLIGSSGDTACPTRRAGRAKLVHQDCDIRRVIPSGGGIGIAPRRR